MQRRVLAPAWFLGEKDLTLASGQSGSAGPKVPDPSIPGEARHCSPHVTTSSKMALAERQRLSRSPMGTCRCRKVCVRRPGHIGNPACPSETLLSSTKCDSSTSAYLMSRLAQEAQGDLRSPEISLESGGAHGQSGSATQPFLSKHWCQ